MLGRAFGQKWKEEELGLYWIMLGGWVSFNPCASLNIIRIINSEVELDWEHSTRRRGKRQLGGWIILKWFLFK
jgi:hypothetical protein